MPFIYRYLRGDMTEIDMGPYPRKEEAKKKMEEHSSFGATCYGPIEISKNYEIFKSNY